MEMRACAVMETKQLRIHHDRVIIKTNLGSALTVRQNSISKAFLLQSAICGAQSPDDESVSDAN
jgi:hypothetical protein